MKVKEWAAKIPPGTWLWHGTLQSGDEVLVPQGVDIIELNAAFLEAKREAEQAEAEAEGEGQADSEQKQRTHKQRIEDALARFYAKQKAKP